MSKNLLSQTYSLCDSLITVIQVSFICVSIASLSFSQVLVVLLTFS